MTSYSKTPRPLQPSCSAHGTKCSQRGHRERAWDGTKWGREPLGPRDITQQLGHAHASAGQIWPRFDQPNPGQIRPSLGACTPELARLLPTLARHRRTLARFRPKLLGFDQHSGGSGPKWTEVRPKSAKVGLNSTPSDLVSTDAGRSRPNWRQIWPNCPTHLVELRRRWAEMGPTPVQVAPNFGRTEKKWQTKRKIWSKASQG